MIRKLSTGVLLLIVLSVANAHAHSGWHWVGYDGCVAKQTNTWKYKSAYIMAVKAPNGTACSSGVCKAYPNVALMNSVTGAWAEAGVSWASNRTTGMLYYRSSINTAYTVITSYAIPLNQQVRTEIWVDSKSGAVMAKWSWGANTVTKVMTGFPGTICSASYVDIYNPSSTAHPGLDIRVDSIFPQEGTLQTVSPYSALGGPWGFRVFK